jgi:hypothetical protein
VDAGIVPAERVGMGSMMERGRRSQRLGSAAIVVRLGYNHWSPTITVTREDDGAVLLETPVAADAWDRLWAVLESFGTDDE